MRTNVNSESLLIARESTFYLKSFDHSFVAASLCISMECSDIDFNCLLCRISRGIYQRIIFGFWVDSVIKPVS
jgi:hypothetical protein